MLLTDDQVKSRLAENVNRLLAEREWSQADLARATGESSARVFNLLKARKLASAGFILRVAEVLGVSTDYLYAPSRKNSEKIA